MTENEGCFASLKSRAGKPQIACCACLARRMSSSDTPPDDSSERLHAQLLCSIQLPYASQDQRAGGGGRRTLCPGGRAGGGSSLHEVQRVSVEDVVVLQVVLVLEHRASADEPLARRAHPTLQLQPPLELWNRALRVLAAQNAANRQTRAAIILDGWAQYA